MKRSRNTLWFVRTIFRWLVVGGVLVFFVFVAGASAALWWYGRDLPRLEDLRERRQSQSTKIFDRTGRVLLYEFYTEERRTIVPYARIPQAVKDATVAAEDAEFWTHPGLNLRGIIRALVLNLLRAEFVQGGSTITQQVIKNAVLTPERTLSRKIREALLALEIERRVSKEEILELYLNHVAYGSHAYGIETAAQTFFGKRAEGLTLAEAALLTALPKAPSYYSPYGAHREELKARQEYILERMVALGSITTEERDRARAAPLAFAPPRDSIRAPHFVFWLRELLAERYGPLEEQGLSVVTSLDWELQEALEGLVREAALANDKRYQAKNAAAVVLNPHTGEVLAMVGSRDYFDTAVDGNVNVALRPRQPGSAFKPLAYAVAFRKGYRPETVVFDAETNFGIPPDKPYVPQNYDGRFRGPVTLAEALAQSLNVPSVKVLYLAGLNEVLNFAKDVGITTLRDRSRYGLSLVLGGGDVKLLELARAYGVFATEGVLVASRPILRVETADGHILENVEPRVRTVLDPELARVVTSILSDNALRAPIFGAHSPLVTPGVETAVKTGTTQEFRDAWTIGYTPELVVGVWVGNNDNSPMTKGGAGVMAAGPLWRNAITAAAARYPADTLFGKPLPQPTLTKPMVGGSLAGSHDILFYTDRDRPTELNGPQTEDPQRARWEEGVARWVNTHGVASLTPIANLAAPPSP